MALNASFAKFQSERAETAARNSQFSRPASSAPTRTTTPKPSDSFKRSHDAAFSSTSNPSNTVANTPAAAAELATQRAGSELMTQLLSAQKYLKDKYPEITPFENIISYLSLPTDAQKNIPLIKNALMKNQHAKHFPKNDTLNTTGKDSFQYRPLIPVTNAEELKDYLATLSSRSASGIAVKDLKDGWPNCNDHLDALESQGFLLITRWKKDSTPRTIFPDSPSYHILNSNTGLPQKVDETFMDVWGKTKVPAGEGDVRAELEKAGLTPTSQVKEVRKGIVEKKKEKRRVNRKGGKTTNAHMLGILKDYSKK